MHINFVHQNTIVFFFNFFFNFFCQKLYFFLIIYNVWICLFTRFRYYFSPEKKNLDLVCQWIRNDTFYFYGHFNAIYIDNFLFDQFFFSQLPYCDFLLKISKYTNRKFDFFLFKSQNFRICWSLKREKITWKLFTVLTSSNFL